MEETLEINKVCVTKLCSYCGNRLDIYGVRPHGLKKYCSDTCRIYAWRKKIALQKANKRSFSLQPIEDKDSCPSNELPSKIDNKEVENEQNRPVTK